MKYIITESRLNKVIFNYLDTMLSGLERNKGMYYDIIFGFPNEKYGVLGWEKPGVLGIYYKIIDEISHYFGMEDSDIEKIIGEWVEDKYNLKVINTNLILQKFPIWLKIDTI
jgi:hypothetical protein